MTIRKLIRFRNTRGFWIWWGVITGIPLGIAFYFQGSNTDGFDPINALITIAVAIFVLVLVGQVLRMFVGDSQD